MRLKVLGIVLVPLLMFAMMPTLAFASVADDYNNAQYKDTMQAANSLDISFSKDDGTVISTDNPLTQSDDTFGFRAEFASSNITQIINSIAAGDISSMPSWISGFVSQLAPRAVVTGEIDLSIDLNEGLNGYFSVNQAKLAEIEADPDSLFQGNADFLSTFDITSVTESGGKINLVMTVKDGTTGQDILDLENSYANVTFGANDLFVVDPSLWSQITDINKGEFDNLVEISCTSATFVCNIPSDLTSLAAFVGQHNPFVGINLQINPGYGKLNLGFSVTYDTNIQVGYAGVAPVDQASPYTLGDTVTVLSDVAPNGIHWFAWPGHRFTGWNTESDGSGTSYAVGSTFTITQDTVLYAQWEAMCTLPSPDIVKTVTGGDDPDLSSRTFHFPLTADSSNPVDGVQGLSTTATITGAELENAGGSYTLAEAFGTVAFSEPGIYVYRITEAADTGTGYTYDVSTYTWTINVMAREAGEGANPREELEVIENTLVDSEGPAVTASFTNDYPKANTYTIHFDANATDAAGTMADEAMTCGTAADLTANAFVRDGYTFAGWNTSADGTGTPYADAASVEDLTTTDGATVTLYAQWKANAVTTTTTTTVTTTVIPQTGDGTSLTAFVSVALLAMGVCIAGIALKARGRTCK